MILTSTTRNNAPINPKTRQPHETNFDYRNSRPGTIHIMKSALSNLIERFEGSTLSGTNVIPWSCPVPSFGDPSLSFVATLGLNPSNREFVDGAGNELDGTLRRFHTLKSLGLARWSDATARHVQLIVDSCRAYFSRNPYDGWFRKLDYLIGGTKVSYYNGSAGACHLDLIPYATSCKWTELTPKQRSLLVSVSGNTLGLLLHESKIRLLILNGNSVVDQFQSLSGVQLEKRVMPQWALPRRQQLDVAGVAYKGIVSEVSGVRLDRDLLVLGFNHNIQSSFGVTTQVRDAIRRWITRAAATVHL
jgi:hypothetical protein